uniref:Homologous-pairing protein 2 winged helix domain-containing protein n=1 Tax=Hyaloperonospora arabidopsidis (strain Emoy2) TaxID=559515 RepID=M4BPY5_HYAAE
MSDLDDDDFSLGDDSSEAEVSSALEEDEEDGSEGGSEAGEDESVASDAPNSGKKAGLKVKKAEVARTNSRGAKSAKSAQNDAKLSSRSMMEKKSDRSEKIAAIKGKTTLAVPTKSPISSKPKALTAANAEAAVLDYMRKNMHRVIAKPSLTTLLDNLVAKKELVSKTYGKAKIYFVNQENLPVPSEEERVALEEEIKAVTAECTALEQQLKNAETALAGLTSQISDTDLDTMLTQLDEEAAALEKKIKKLDQQDRAPLSPARKETLKRKFTKYRVRLLQHATILIVLCSVVRRVRVFTVSIVIRLHGWRVNALQWMESTRSQTEWRKSQRLCWIWLDWRLMRRQASRSCQVSSVKVQELYREPTKTNATDIIRDVALCAQRLAALDDP